MKIVLSILIGLLVLLQYRLWFGDGGVITIIHLKHQVAAQQAINKALDERNQVLIAEVNDLKSGHQAIEERARGELGMIKKDETFYQIVK